MRRPLLLALAAGSLAALTACGPTDTTAAGTSSAAPTTPSPVVAATAPPVVAAPTTSSQAPTSAPASAAFAAFAMPNFVGTDLQTAQNGVQTHGIFYSTSHDLRGSRHQILDSDWTVCTQNIPPGQQVTSDIEGQIDFGVVKRSESCP